MSNNKQQTAVDLYRIKISILTTDLFNEKISGNQFRTLEREAYEQAKAMHKEEIEQTYQKGYNDADFSYYDPEQYYNETYGGNK
jgi:hypothetical protein